MIIGFWYDKPKYKPTLFCRIGIHKASRYVFERIGNTDYFVCSHCGKRYKIID